MSQGTASGVKVDVSVLICTLGYEFWLLAWKQDRFLIELSLIQRSTVTGREQFPSHISPIFKWAPCMQYSTAFSDELFLYLMCWGIWKLWEVSTVLLIINLSEYKHPSNSHKAYSRSWNRFKTGLASSSPVKVVICMLADWYTNEIGQALE